MSFFFRHLPSMSGAFNTNYRALMLYIGNRSLRAWSAAARHYAMRLRGRPSPTFVTVAVTYRCQCRCAHCYSSSPSRSIDRELTTPELRSVLRQVKGLGAMAVHFSGGEPLLREDLFELVSYARELGLVSRVNTNGLLLNEKNVARLKAAGVTECGVSLDSTEPVKHNSFRGVPRLYDRVIDGVEILNRFGVPCRIMTVASRESIPDGIRRLKSLAFRMGAHRMYIVTPIAAGEWDQASAELLTPGELAQLRELQDLTFAHLEMPSANTNCCVYRKNLLYVSANGNVTPCPFVPFVLGSLEEWSLDEIWRSHCNRMNLVFRGDCPMNYPEHREAMRRHVEAVAQDLQSTHAPSRPTLSRLQRDVTPSS